LKEILLPIEIVSHIQSQTDLFKSLIRSGNFKPYLLISRSIPTTLLENFGFQLVHSEARSLANPDLAWGPKAAAAFRSLLSRRLDSLKKLILRLASKNKKALVFISWAHKKSMRSMYMHSMVISVALALTNAIHQRFEPSRFFKSKYLKSHTMYSAAYLENLGPPNENSSIDILAVAPNLQILPSAIIYPEFNYFYGHLQLFSWALRTGVLQFVFPFSLVNRKEWLESFSREKRLFRMSIPNLLADLLFPSWTAKWNGRKVRIPLAYAISAFILGYRTSDPWLHGHSNAISILVPDSFSMDYYLDAGYKSERMVLTGSPTGPRILSARQNFLRARNNATNLRPKVLLAVPPNQLGEDKESEYLHSILVPFLSPFSDHSMDLVLNLHPRCSEFTRLKLLDMGLSLDAGSVADSIAECDLYIAASSATIKTAISLGVPSINFDVYGYGYGDYDNVPSVTNVGTKRDYDLASKLSLSCKKSYEPDSALGLSFETILRKLISGM
jgi:hypothetical protein